ncbi:MAG TPA: DUF2271 domain-containing protein [Burkholderiaceae bacterium]|nr:DUF2271 domain-containing protein [Burkholderiaceae bacterium]
MSVRQTIALAAASAAVPAVAADLSVSVEIPRLNVAEYHRPYVAIWIEKADRSFAGNLAVWYDVKLRNNEGTKWLKDMRAWWRKSGRDLAMPIDGLSSPTRAPGEHTVTFSQAKAPLDRLAPGNYELVVEAAREVGGRELVRIPFEWPPAAAGGAKVRGEHELGLVSVSLKP